MNTIPKTNDDYAFKNSSYLQSNPDWHTKDSYWKASQIIKMIDRNRLEPKEVVEIGCGAGEILSQLSHRMQDKSINFSGYEIAPDAFELCKLRIKDRLNYFQQDILKIDNKFDLLLMIDVFEHIHDCYNFIREASKKSDYGIYHIPMDMSALGIIINYPIEARKNVGHIHHFMKDTALATIIDSGLEVIDWFYTPSAFELKVENRSFFTKTINILRRLIYWINPDFAVRLLGGFSLLVLAKH
jgi:SAM-dependent methyltransferase